MSASVAMRLFAMRLFAMPRMRGVCKPTACASLPSALAEIPLSLSSL